MVIRGIMRSYWKKGVNHRDAAKEIYEFEVLLITNKRQKLQVKKTKFILVDKETLILKVLKYRYGIILR